MTELSSNVESSSSGNPVLSITAENQGSLKVLIFGDSQTGGPRGTGSKIREKLIAAGLNANNVHVSTNVSMTTEFLIEMATANGGRGDFKGESTSLNNDPRWRRPRSNWATHWNPSSANPFPTSEYDIVFMFAGGNDTNAPGRWNRFYLNTGGSVSRLASLFGSKLIWIGPAPSTRITAQRVLSRPAIGGNAELYLSGATANVDGTPMVAAQRREEYNNRLKRTLANTGVLYLDVREIPSRSLPGAVEQLPGIYFPNLGDGLHIHSGANGRTTVDRISSWVLEKAQNTASANVAAGTGAGATSAASSAASRSSSPNIALGHTRCGSTTNAAAPVSSRLGDPTGEPIPSSGPGVAFPVDGRSAFKNSYGRSWGPNRPQGHTGIDVFGPRNAPVRSPFENAKVTGVRSGQQGAGGGAGGNYVVLIDTNGTGNNRAYFAHLSQVDVTIGQIVSRGQQLGLQGNTGSAYRDGNGAQHVHIEWKVRQGESSEFQRVNPYPILELLSEPVEETAAKLAQLRRQGFDGPRRIRAGVKTLNEIAQAASST